MFPYAQARRLQVGTSDSVTKAELKMIAHKDKWNIDNASARECYHQLKLVDMSKVQSQPLDPTLDLPFR